MKLGLPKYANKIIITIKKGCNTEYMSEIMDYFLSKGMVGSVDRKNKIINFTFVGNVPFVPENIISFQSVIDFINKGLDIEFE